MMLEGNSAELVPCIPDVWCSVVCEYRILTADCGLWQLPINAALRTELKKLSFLNSWL